ncbi:PREDICTED: uncharacterized protein LOC105555782 [Vollenhovia emeryi]|uniref:uncharacterized protein LOC105555782 n=1 Tax=Vollenhovia emeryi TaxID=411798 RepID=UPI0005F5297D|nr:PREDICTED: uncharacterized protein LOC105555782 [Vollenhovia emeryi]
MDRVKSSLDIHINKCYYWTDSSIVLHWLKGTNKKLPVFVAHRVGEIQEMSTVENWNHVGTKENPADLISRGVSPRELVKSSLWWKGPTWLEDDGLIRCRLEVQEIDDSRLDEADRSEIIAMLVHEDIDLFTRFSTFNKLVRVTATCLRFAQLCRKQYSGEASGPLSVVEIEYARRSLIKGAQRAYFSSELEALKDGRAVSGRSNLRDMNPFIDADGLLRVGGRLRHSRLQHDAKHPILLPRCSRLTELIIEQEHKKLLHAGVEATLAAIRLSYWPIRARGTIKRIIRQCVVCFKARPRLSEQLMGDLPSCRVTPSRPFSNTGVDFCGPIYIKEGKRIKAYVAVFICMATKAVHLEVVSELSDAFLNSFKRFIGRRGRPTDVFSDNGTNFVGANRELEELRNLLAKEEHQRKIVDATSSDGIKWHFIPPRAPHFGGLWEAAVKSFKAHFCKVASEAALSFEEATTLVIQVEAILNSRLLIALSSDPNDLSYISPGHFLIGDALVAYPEPDLAHIKIGRLSRWQRVEQIRQHFWQRWSSEYLLQLQRRSKWTMNRGMQLQVGQLVLCREDGLPPLKWLLGRVQEVCPGNDGIVRAAVIKTSKGAFKRPAVRLSIMPFEQCSDRAAD